MVDRFYALGRCSDYQYDSYRNWVNLICAHSNVSCTCNFTHELPYVHIGMTEKNGCCQVN